MDNLILGVCVLLAVMFVLAFWNGSRPANSDAKTHARLADTDAARFGLEKARDEKNETRYNQNKQASDYMAVAQFESIRRQEISKGCWANHEVVKLAEAAIEAVDISNGAPVSTFDICGSTADTGLGG